MMVYQLCDGRKHQLPDGRIVTPKDLNNDILLKYSRGTIIVESRRFGVKITNLTSGESAIYEVLSSTL